MKPISHQLGIPGLSRKSVGAYLEKLGAFQAPPIKGGNDKIILPEPAPEPEDKSPKFLQGKLNF